MRELLFLLPQLFSPFRENSTHATVMSLFIHKESLVSLSGENNVTHFVTFAVD
jgi:hypothetical protein